MMNFLRKHMRKIFFITILAFIGGIFMGFGSYLFGPENDYKTAATVNGEKVPMKLFSALYTNSSEMYKESSKTDLTPEQANELKVRTLQAMVQEEIFYQQSKAYGIVVSDSELKNDIQFSAMFRNNNQFDSRLYYAFLRAMGMTPKEYEHLRKKQIAGEKLKMILGTAIKLSDSEFNSLSANYPKLTRDELTQSKINSILNEWYSNIVKGSKISTNDSIFK